MAHVRVPEEKRTITSSEKIADYLNRCGIQYEQWAPRHKVKRDAANEAILEAYSEEIQRLSNRGGYKAADVVQLNPDTPGLEAMLAKFNREHWHDEDEVRFVIFGHGLFHVRPKEGAVAAIEVEAGDLLLLPRGTLHWFDLCQDKQIRAIRLFQDPKGWTPYYSESGVDQNYQPMCLGLSYVPLQQPRFDDAG